MVGCLARDVGSGVSPVVGHPAAIASAITAIATAPASGEPMLRSPV